MKMTLTVFAILLTASAAFSQQRSTPESEISAAAQETATQQSFVEKSESELLRLLNQERTRRGLQPLAWDQRLQKAAREHSLRMADQHVLSHGFPGEPELPRRLASAGLRFDRSGENVAFGSKTEQVHQGLMNSPVHRENILNRDFNAAGIGVVLRYGLLWVTEDFAHRLEFRTAGQVENLLAQKFDQARRQAGRKPARREKSPGLEPAACSMAEKGKLDSTPARDLFGGPAGAAVFNGADLSDLPSGWRKVAQMPSLSRYAVGVCFHASPEFPSGGYWAVLVFE